MDIIKIKNQFKKNVEGSYLVMKKKSNENTIIQQEKKIMVLVKPDEKYHRVNWIMGK